MKNIFPALFAFLFFNSFLPLQKANAQKQDKRVAITGVFPRVLIGK